MILAAKIIAGMVAVGFTAFVAYCGWAIRYLTEFNDP